MRRWAALLGLLAGPIPASAAAEQGDAHRHAGFLFQIRFEPDLNADRVYRAFLPDPADPASLIVERGAGYLGDERRVDLDPAACPALRRAVAALADLPAPAVALGEAAPYDYRQRRPGHYYFNGFVRFPNGGEGELSFQSYDVPGRPADPQLAWMRGLVRAFDACRPPAR
ncbi:MAG TPA: hypothetical protein VMG08_18425 [Allosphingosinicella sp.]|nr:hypothetical protein [Allosphingosinicella sp.]